jgi:site-specific DNA-methyltransferase (adenine-specific)
MFDENWSPSIELVIYDVDPIIRKYAEENGLDHLEETASSLFRKHPDGSYPLLKEVLQTQMGPETKELEKNYTHRLYNGVDEHFTRDISIFTPRSKAHHDIVKSVLGSMIDDYKLLTPKIAPIVRLENNIHSFGAYIKDPELRLYNKLKKLQEFQKDTPNCFVLCQTGFIGFTFKKLCKILILRDLKDWCTFMQMAYRCMTPDDNSERSYPRKVVIYSSGLTFVHTLQKHISQGCKTEKEVGEKLEKFLRVFKIYLGDKPLDVATFNKKMSEMYAFNLDRVATNIALNYGIGDAFDTSGVKGSIRGVTVKGTIGDPSKGKAKSSGDNGDDNDDDEENGDEELTDEEKIGKSKEALLSKMFILNTAFVCLYKSDKEPWVLNKDSMFDVVDKFNDEDKLLFKDSTGHDWNEVNTKWFTPVVRNNLNAGMMINNYWIGCRDKRREGLSLADIIERDEHNIKLFGDVKTPVELVNTILDKIPEEIFRDSNKTFIDNACGMGTFLLESAKRRLKNGLDKQTVAKTTFGVDIRKKNVVVTIMELCRLLGEENRKLIEHNIVCADSLEFDYWNGMKFDVILNNPKKSNAIKFFEHSIKLLKSDGLLISIQSFSWIEDRKNMEHSYKMLKTKCGNRVSLIYVFNGNFYFEMGSFTPSCFIVLNNKKKDSSVLVENEINGKITIYSNIFSVNKFDNEFLYIPLENKILKYANASNIKQLIGIENGNIEVTLPFIVGNWNNLKCEIEKPNFYNMVNSSVEICEHKSSKKGLKFYFKTKNEAQNFVRYLKTKFARFCLSIYKINQNIHRGELGSIPIINFDNFIDEKDLYKKFNIKDDEIEFIKSSIKD